MCVRPLHLLVSVLLCSTASFAEQEVTPSFLSEGHYAGGGVGWTILTGNVSSVTGLIDFDAVPISVRADDLYDQGLNISLFGGLRSNGALAEIDINMRLSPVTESGQTLINSTGPVADRDVNIEYATFDVVGGRYVTIGDSETYHVSVFGAVGVGLALLQLSQGTGVEPYNDQGFSMSIKAGVDWLPSGSVPLMIRLAVRYQVLSAGVDLPHDVIPSLSVGYVFDQ